MGDDKKCKCTLITNGKKTDVDGVEDKKMEDLEKTFSDKIAKNLQFYWTGEDKTHWDPKEPKDNENDYTTIWKCTRNAEGYYESVELDKESAEKKWPCYNLLYIELCIIHTLLDKQKHNKHYINRVKKTIEYLDGVYNYKGDLLKALGTLKLTKKDLLIDYMLLKRGLLTGDYMIKYNANCILHCGVCGKCSTEKDLDVIFNTKADITENMTKCSVEYAKFKRMGGHSDKEELEKCLKKKHIDFTPMCRDVWYDDIDCAASFCKRPCWMKFSDSGGVPTGLLQKIRNVPNKKDCLECDEKICGPAFIHAGANRRSSGIESDIERSETSKCTSGLYSNYFETDQKKFIKKIEKFLGGCHAYIKKFNKKIEKITVEIEEEILKDRSSPPSIVTPLKVEDIAKLYTKKFQDVGMDVRLLDDFNKIFKKKKIIIK